MQITRATDYATRIVLDLSIQEPGRWLAQSAIAERQDVPVAFLSKIVGQLAHAGLVETQRGAKGGTRLARKPENVTLLDVVNAVEGPLALNICLAHEDACEHTSKCVFHPIWEAIQNDLVTHLQSVNFADLAEQNAALLQEEAG